MFARTVVTVGLLLLASGRPDAEAQQPSKSPPPASPPRGASPTRPAAAPPPAAPSTLRALVWVNAGTRVYHCPGSPYYGTTKDGEFMTEAAARARRNRAAEGSGCSAAALRAGPPTPKAPGLVWLDTGTGRYHCPGSARYARTDRGRFLEERAAQRAGHAPATQRCRAG